MTTKSVHAFDKKFVSIKKLADHYKISHSALSARLRQGQSPEKAIQKLSPIIVSGQSFKTLAAVAKYFGVPAATLRHRVNKLGMSYEQAIKKPVKKLITGPVLIRGIRYSSFAAAAKAFGKDPEVCRNRMKRGMSAEDAIFKPNQRNKKITYLGKNFESFKSFCDYFELNRSTANSRFRRNWELSDIIQKPTAKNREISYSGKDYPSILALSKDLGLDYKLVYKRIHSFKWTVKDAVETPKKLGRSVSVHGKNFPTLKAAAKHFGVPAGLLQWRIATGWPLEKAVDPEAEVNNRKPIEIDGEYFADLSSAARAYGLNPTTFMRRIKYGWSIEQAIGASPPPENNRGPDPVTTEEYKKRLYEIHGENLDFSKSVFGKAQDKIQVICKAGVEHASFWATPNNLLRGKGCPICKISHGARKVALFLDTHEIKYEVEWTGHGLRSLKYTRAVLRIDFHLPDKKTVIEFDGIQHFEPQTLGRMTEEEAKLAFEQTKENDQRKNEWAKENGYKMIRIRYDESVSKKLQKALSF